MIFGDGDWVHIHLRSLLCIIHIIYSAGVTSMIHAVYPTNHAHSSYCVVFCCGWYQSNEPYIQDNWPHYNDVIMDAMTSQMTSLAIVYSSVYLGTDKRKHQSSASLAFVRGIHRWPVNSPHKGPLTRKVFPFDDVIMWHRDNHTFATAPVEQQWGLQIVFVCLYITPSHHHHCANLSADIELITCLSDIFCRMCEYD